MSVDSKHASLQISSNHLPISVITTCYGRNRHLYNLLASLQAGTKQPAEVIIVNDDADQQQLQSYNLNIRQVAIAPVTTTVGKDEDTPNSTQNALKNTGFDIGRNRNLGAQQASYETLIFLDVDCIVATRFIEGLTEKLQKHLQALIMGQPRYLIRPLNESEAQRLTESSVDNDDTNIEGTSKLDSWLTSISVLNPYRHNLISEDSSNTQQKDSPTLEQTQDYGSFWSLCFAIKKSQYEKIGGFDVDYVGYGAEDTDFAFTARQLEIDFYLTNDVVYHQQHSVYRPPLNHLNSIVINANRFYEKWHHWPMAGWLAEFASMRLIKWTETQENSISLLRQPTDHEIKEAHCPDAAFV